jgi:hypothetical protein
VNANHGDVKVGGDVGSAEPLADLDIAAAAIDLKLATLRVDDDNAAAQTITFTGPVLLEAHLRIDTDKATPFDSGLVFTGTVDGAFSLDIGAGSGTATFGGPVGNATPLAKLTTDADGTTQINGGLVKTTGDQTYGDAVVIGNPTRLTTLSGAKIQLSSTGSLNGAAPGESAKIEATDTMAFDGPEGNSQPLDKLTLDAHAAVTQAQAIKGAGLELLGAGPFTLVDAANEFTTLAAAVSAAVNYNDATALTIGTVNSTAGAGAASIAISAGGTLTVAADVSGGGKVALTANEASAAGNDVILLSGVTVQSSADDVCLNAGDNFNLPVGSTVKAGGAGKEIHLASLDIIENAGDTAGSTFDVHGALAASRILMTGAPGQNDTFHVLFTNIVGPVEVRGSTNAAALAPGSVRDGRDMSADAAKRPFFVPAAAAFAIGDQLLADDRGFATRDARYTLAGSGITRVGGAAFVSFPDHDLEQIELKTSLGNNDVTAVLGGVFPAILQIDATGDPFESDNRFEIEGSADADKISIGDVDSSLRTSAGPLRAHFELAGIQRLWIRGNAGNDVIDNISHIHGVLDGGAGNDTINSIVDDGSSYLTLNSRDIANSARNDLTLILGNLGQDQLFVGAGAVDQTIARDSVADAVRQFPDTGITFLLGDYTPGGLQANGAFCTLIPAVSGGEPGDSYSSSARTLQHGFITLGDDTRAAGVFKYLAGDRIIFSSTIAWLKAQLFVGVARDNLVTMLGHQLRDDTRPVAASPLPPPPPAPLLPPPASPPAGEGELVPLERMDVNRDGTLSPLDALLIINSLNASGGGQLPAAPDNEGEAESFAAIEALDINKDAYITPLDALLVINALNSGQEIPAAAGGGAEGEGSGEENAGIDNLSLVGNPSVSPAEFHDEEVLNLLASDWQTAERRRYKPWTTAERAANV